MEVSRRGFLKFVGGAGATFAAAAVAAKEVVGDAVATITGRPNTDEEKLLRYWYLKDYLGSKEYDQTTGLGMFPKENQALWNEYYELIDYFVSVGGIPRVRVVAGELVFLDREQPQKGWRALFAKERKKA